MKNRVIKTLWSIVALIFVVSVVFLAYNYFSGDANTAKKTVTKKENTEKSKSSKDNNKKDESVTEENKEKTQEDKDENSENDKKSSNKEKSSNSKNKENNKNNKDESKKSESNDNQSNDKEDAVEETNKIKEDDGNKYIYPRTYTYNGRNLSPIFAIGTTGKVFATQSEAMEYGQNELDRLVREDKKKRQFAVGRVLYDDNSLAGWTVDIYDK